MERQLTPRASVQRPLGCRMLEVYLNSKWPLVLCHMNLESSRPWASFLMLPSEGKVGQGDISLFKDHVPGSKCSLAFPTVSKCILRDPSLYSNIYTHLKGAMKLSKGGETSRYRFRNNQQYAREKRWRDRNQLKTRWLSKADGWKSVLFWSEAEGSGDEKPTNTETDKNIWLISAEYQKDSLREQIPGDRRVRAE